MKLPALLLGLLLFAAPAKFRVAVPGYHWQFPRDAYAHPDFATEWWYFTGNLRTAAGCHSADPAAASGRRPAGGGGGEAPGKDRPCLFGFELTFFRIAPAPGTPLNRQLYFTHFSITNAGAGSFAFHTRAHRGNWAQAGVAHTPAGFRLWDENWTADFDARGPRHLHARWGQLSLDLALVPGRRMLNGLNGWSQKGSASGEASDYYSFPHILAHGAVNGTAVAGLVWMDHEFATDQLAPDQLGWDWMGLHLPSGDLMLFNLRLNDGRRGPHSAGTWRPSGGAPIALHASDFQLTPIAWWNSGSGKYPIVWRVQLPRFGLNFQLTAEVKDQLIRAPAMGVQYWEGAVTTSNGGEGYLELTGYSGQPLGRLH